MICFLKATGPTQGAQQKNVIPNDPLRLETGDIGESQLTLNKVNKASSCDASDTMLDKESNGKGSVQSMKTLLVRTESNQSAGDLDKSSNKDGSDNSEGCSENESDSEVMNEKSTLNLCTCCLFCIIDVTTVNVKFDGEFMTC